jgi:transcriptional antiterminator RfaH
VAGWAVVIAKPNSEAIAVVNLQRQGYETYLPRFKLRKVNKPTLIKPLFPRYLFVHIDKFWYSIRGTRGVSGILLADDGPAIVNPAVVAAIKAKEDSEGYISLGREDRQEKFIKGQPVKTLEGPFAGLSMIYEGMSVQDRVKVLADILGRQVQIVVSESKLVAA